MGDGMRALSALSVPGIVVCCGVAACGFEGQQAAGAADPSSAQLEPGTILGQIIPNASGGRLGVALLPLTAPLTKLEPCLRPDQAVDADFLDSAQFTLVDIDPGTYHLAVSRFVMAGLMLVESETSIRQVTVTAESGLDVGRIELPPRLEIQTSGETASWTVPVSYQTEAYRMRYGNACDTGTALTVTGTYTATAGKSDYVKVVMEQPQSGRFAVRVVNP